MTFSARAPRTWVGVFVSLALAAALALFRLAPWWVLPLVAGTWAVLILCHELAYREEP